MLIGWLGFKLKLNSDTVSKGLKSWVSVERVTELRGMGFLEDVFIFDHAKNVKAVRRSSCDQSDFLRSENSLGSSHTGVVNVIWMNDRQAWIGRWQIREWKIWWKRIRTDFKNGIIKETIRWSLSMISNLISRLHGITASQVGRACSDVGAQLPFRYISRFPPLEYPDTGYNNGCNYEPERKAGNILGVDRKLSSIFGNLPIYVQLFIGVAVGLFSCFIFGLSLWFFDKGRPFIGIGFALLGFLLFLCDGLVVTGFL